MKRLCMLALMALTGVVVVFAQVRTVENLNFGWKFHAGDVDQGASVQLDDASWRTVDVPHDFQIEQP